MSGFWIGLLIGIWLGRLGGMIVMAALSAGSDADDKMGLL